MRCALLTLTLFFAAFAMPVEGEPDCRLKLFADLETQMTPQGLVTVPVMINGQQRTFLIDAGATESVISAATAHSFGMTARFSPTMAIMFGGIPIATVVHADTFTLGKMTAEDFPMMLAPTGALPPSIDGLLGANVLHNYDVELDFAKSRFRLFSPDHCPGKVVYWTNGPYAKLPLKVTKEFHMVVPTTIDGVSVDAILDTGSQETILTIGAGMDLFHFKSSDPRLKKQPPVMVNGLAQIERWSFPFSTLALDTFTINNPSIELMDGNDYLSDPPRLLVGGDVLRKLHLYVAYGEGTLYFTDAEAR